MKKRSIVLGSFAALAMSSAAFGDFIFFTDPGEFFAALEAQGKVSKGFWDFKPNNVGEGFIGAIDDPLNFITAPGTRIWDNMPLDNVQFQSNLDPYGAGGGPNPRGVEGLAFATAPFFGIKNNVLVANTFVDSFDIRSGVPVGDNHAAMALNVISLASGGGDVHVTVWDENEGHKAEWVLPGPWQDNEKRFLGILALDTRSIGRVNIYDVSDGAEGISEIEVFLLGVSKSNRAPIPTRQSFGGKFRRVDIHGVPMPDRSPTGEGEDDRLPNMAYIDMYSLAPLYSVTDVAVPVEGGELTLEFRRTSGIRSFRHSTDVSKQGVTFPSDFILGLGWDTNLNSRIVVAFDPIPDLPDHISARVTDEVGNFYQYTDGGQNGEGNPFAPNLYHSFTNDAVRAKLFRQNENTLVLVKVFGTRLTYQKIGRFTPPDPGNVKNWEDYYRLASVEDRNGNKLEYVYDSDDPDNRRSFLVAEIHEEDHSERQILFTYTLGTGPNGEDRGDRLNTVTDPLDRETHFSFGRAWDLLLEVQREAVPDAENGGEVVEPVVTFGYHTIELPVEETSSPPDLPDQDPTTRNRFVGLNSVTDARGHVTTFAYTEDFFPSSIAPNEDNLTYYQEKIRLTGASTIDGSVVLTQEERTAERVVTRSQDTAGSTVKYDFLAEKLPIDNPYGVALVVNQFTRTTEALPENNAAVFEWTLDSFANLIHVTDINGNTIDYEYDDLPAQQSNQPTQRTITDTDSGEAIVTAYEYGPFSKMDRLVDGEGKETVYVLDGNGNRTEIREELGTTTFYQYDPDGFVTEIKDPDGRVTTFSRIFDPDDLSKQYTVTSIVTGFKGELLLDTESVYDVMGNEVEMIDPEENVYTHEYDALYRRNRTTNPPVEESPGGPLVPSTVEYTYTLNGSAVEEKDDNGDLTANQYDLMNRLTETRRRMTDPDFNDDANDLITRNTYTPVGLLATTTDPNGNVTEFEYDALLRLTRETVDANVLGYFETYEYGTDAGSGAFVYTSGWQPTRVINRRGFAQDTTYDGFYRAVVSIRRQSDGVGIEHDDPPAPNEPTTLMTYNKVHNEIGVTVLTEDSAGGDRTTHTFYDDLHRPTISLLDFDGDGNDGQAYTPETTYVNSAGDFTDHDAEDFITRTEYDLASNVVRVTDREGNATDSTYDGASRVIKVEQAPVEDGRPTTTTTYDNNGNVILVTDPNGNQTQMTYDARNRMMRSIIDLNGDGQFDPSRPGPDIVSDTHYDLVDNIIQTMDPNGHDYDTEYDRAYRVIEVRGPPVADAENAGQMTRPVTAIEYDKNSNVIRGIDPRDVQVVTVYDGLDRAVSVTNAFGTADAVTTTTVHDQNDNVLELTLDNGPAGLQATSFTYDPIDRLETETWPGGNLSTTAYYRNNLLQAVTDPKGQTIESDYDRADRVVTSRHKRADDSIEETRTFNYDKTDNVRTATDLNGTSTYTYDAIYRMITETRADAGQAPYTVTSAYDLNSNRSSVTYPQTGRVLGSTYDRLDRLTQVVDSVGNQTTTYTYDANSNRLSCTLPNRVVDTFTYDALNRVITHDATVRASLTGPASLIYSADYTYDLANQRRTIEETVQGQPTRTLLYDYDNQYRLTSESWQGNNYTYTYDPAGNRLTKTINGVATTYTYNTRNELLTETADDPVVTVYRYDLNGNRVRKAVQLSDRTDYIWDVNDRLVEAKANSATVFRAQYDYRTRRITKTEGATSTYFRYDSGLSCQELVSGTTTINVEFVRGSDLGGGIGSILYADRSDAGPLQSSDFYCYNAVGHTVALTDISGVVAKTDLYEAFGGVVSSTGTSSNNRLAYTKERDASIALDNHGFRYYDPETGRYISRDPAKYVGGLNAYLHVDNNPVNDFDPQGLLGFWRKLAQATVDTLRGVGDTITFGGTKYLREKIHGQRGAVINKTAYARGEIAGEVLKEGLIAASTGGVGNLALKGSKVAKLVHKGLQAVDKGRDILDAKATLEQAAQGDLTGAALKGGMALIGRKGKKGKGAQKNAAGEGGTVTRRKGPEGTTSEKMHKRHILAQKVFKERHAQLKETLQRSPDLRKRWEQNTGMKFDDFDKWSNKLRDSPDNIWRGPARENLSLGGKLRHGKEIGEIDPKPGSNLYKAKQEWVKQLPEKEK